MKPEVRSQQEIEEIVKLFPVTLGVTQELLDKSERGSIRNCNGYNLLKDYLSVYGICVGQHDGWGTTVGHLARVEHSKGDGEAIYISSSGVNMMDVVAGDKITLKITHSIFD